MLLLSPGILCYCQKTAAIRNVDFSLVGNKLVITYSITDFKSNDRFNVKAEIFKATGERVNAISFTGDLKGVQSVTDNKIYWDIEKDNITLDEEIYVVITGEVISAPFEAESEVPAIKRDTPSAAKQAETSKGSRTSYFFESLIFPGWGTSKLTRNNGHLVKGFIGYGAIIGSLLMANKSNLNYNDYRLANTAEDRDKYYNDAKNANNISLMLAGGAAVVWSVDLISVLAVKSKTPGKPKVSRTVNFGYSLAVEHTHQVSCKINF